MRLRDSTISTHNNDIKRIYIYIQQEKKNANGTDGHRDDFRCNGDKFNNQGIGEMDDRNS